MENTERRQSLSSRQAEIAELVAGGKSTREIALLLSLSPRTVETHVAAIFDKYGVSTRAELIATILHERIHEASAAPPARAIFPHPLTELVGRGTEIADITELLRRSRLVTITGAGGIGKSRTALAVGEAILATTTVRGRLVELAALPARAPIVLAVARALGIEGLDERSSITTLAARLTAASLLIILDSCEHVVREAAALAAALLHACPTVRILATSREPLRIAGEQAYRLPSLRAPTVADARTLDAASARAYPSIELFASRALAADAGFTLRDASVPVVAEICRRLDGIPLALELAAARVNVLSIESLAEKLAAHVPVLGGGDRLALPRHRTMRALIDWSYDLLSPPEQRLFERLSVFAGGCTFAQAAAVYSDGEDELAVLDMLSSLVDKSLLVADLRLSEPRYALLQAFRPYASEKLEFRDDASDARQRHALAYAHLAEQLEDEYERAPTAAWYPRATIEVENFTAALRWTLELRRDVALGQRLAAALRPVWFSTGGGAGWLALARDLMNDATPALLAARLDFNAAFAAFVGGAFDDALAMGLRLIGAFGELGDPLRAAYAQTLAAFILVIRGRTAEAETHIATALAAARTHACAPLIALALRARAHASSARGDLAGRRENFVEALAIYEAIGAERHVTMMIGDLADVEFCAGNSVRALELSATCLRRDRTHGSPYRVAQTLVNIAAYSIALDRWSDARAYAREALGLAREIQDSQTLTEALSHLAAVAALELRPVTSTPESSRLAVAARLLGHVDGRYTHLGIVREPTEQREYDRVRRTVRGALAGADFERWTARGASLTPDQAISLALTV